MSNPKALYWSYAQTRAWVALRDHEVVEQAETHPDQASDLSLIVYKAILAPYWQGQPGPVADRLILTALQIDELRSWLISGGHSSEIPRSQWAGLPAIIDSMENVTFSKDEVQALWPALSASFNATTAYEKRLAWYSTSRGRAPTIAEDAAWGKDKGLSRDCVRALRRVLPAGKGGRPKKPSGN
jgi:hypothetical protein